jgi:signal peptidase I
MLLIGKEDRMNASTPPPLPGSRTTRFRFITLALLSILAIGIALVVVVVVDFGQVFSVPTKAMAPTLQPGDLLYASTLPYYLHAPHRGDVIVFKTDGLSGFPGDTPAPIFVKRIAGLPGEKISIRYGRFCVNDSPAKELEDRKYVLGRTYLFEDGNFTVVPDNAYFVLGDNSPNSYDSRYWGRVPKGNIISRVIFRYWPISRISLL